ncbi:class I SAM-dependent methyltransferase [Prochlorococcus sp. MIT 1307]|uniref:class I SAM-dependent methyltransferase n=1 Tax=Prochlorococcus sp. MIT 1307 TaxID=3096219 RepID=UPI002A7545F4|nr:class I SAM-dependent methyltransferase [Prochlorococcus sp. MIT 1307]
MNNHNPINCRISGDPLEEIIDFGLQPLGNGFLTKEDFQDEYFFNMKLGFNQNSQMVQLFEQPEPEKMFHREYAFFSSTSTAMKKHFQEFYRYIINSSYYSSDNPFVVEIGCNDGILLGNFAADGISHLGIEPSTNVADVANKKGINTISEFFSEKLAMKIVQTNGKADIVMSANVMCHIPNILNIVAGLKTLIKDQGVLIFEDPYLGDVIKKTSYDQIYDEHVYLFSAISVQNLFNRFDFELVDLQPQSTHGGSMRYVIAHKDQYEIQPIVGNIIEEERSIGLDNMISLHEFSENIKQSKEKLISILKEIKSNGKTIAGYAATSKSTTILNYCKVGSQYLDYICDTTPIKQGKYSPGMHIPIYPHSHFLENPPDYAFLLAWNHLDEILNKEKSFIDAGGKWILNVPQPRIL